MKEVYIVSACRTALGTFGGSLKNTSAVEMGTIVVKEAMKRANVDPALVEELYMGNVISANLGQNVARQVLIHSGIPKEVTATSLNMVCGSGMKTIIDGSRAIRSGDLDIVVVGGTENMSAAPYYLPNNRWGQRMNDGKVIDGFVKDGLWDAFYDYHMGITAENVAAQFGVTREMQDEWAYISQKNLAKANETNRMADEIVPVTVKVSKKETKEFKVDEHGRPETTMEILAKLKPAFKKDGTGTVTAGNASGINDAAAALVLASGEAVKKYGLKPMAKLVGWGQAGVDPSIMGVGPIEACRKALKKASLEVKDMNLIEANEAFAAQCCAIGKELGFNRDIVNVNGGAIAMGHPIGCSGARIVVTLLHELKRRGQKHGLATLCIGGGMGDATVYEMVD
ncbi:MAG: acetyl-CoA C-acetyltransferase [Oscillospiraceae bacterium]|nr:acetyl-CoA C-acetyltransferase [Oscillospiraceae bacterium]